MRRPRLSGPPSCPRLSRASTSSRGAAPTRQQRSLSQSRKRADALRRDGRDKARPGRRPSAYRSCRARAEISLAHDVEAITSAGGPSATSRPLCSTMMRSASERTTSILCSTSRMVLVCVALQVGDQIEHDGHFVDAHAGGRLVEHQDVGLQRHHHRDFELALIAMRQRGDRRAGAGGKADARQRRLAPLRTMSRRAQPGARIS